MIGSSLAAVILAAGKGTRMRSSLPKVLHSLSGKPLLSYALGAVLQLKPHRVVIVVGYGADQVRKTFPSESKIEFVEQNPQLGTGHAVMQTRELLFDFKGEVLVLCGDMPFIRPSTLRHIIDDHNKVRPACTMLTLKTNKSKDFGKVLRNKLGEVLGIVESSDIKVEQKTIDEYNAGVYCFDKDLLFQAVGLLKNRNAQSEYYLTDTIKYFSKNRWAIHSIQTKDDREIFGINSEYDLTRAELILANLSS